jgi:hypothetical protein
MEKFVKTTRQRVFMEKETGKLIMFIGGLTTLAGLVWYVAGERLQWFGRLPGDFRGEKGNVRFYFPLTSMLLLSLVINLLIRLYKHIR